MAKYSLTFKNSVRKDLRAIPKKDVVRILSEVDSLAENPRPPGCEKLSGRECFRIRQGVYRIIYEIKDEVLIVLVIKIGHRGGIYRRN